MGYRHFDTAFIYGTEGEIGEALNMKFASGELKREDVFVTTKVPKLLFYECDNF